MGSASPPDDETLAGDDTVPGQASRARDDGIRPRQTLGRFVVRAQIGRGGMGVVYAAYDPRLDREVAVKVLRPRPGSPGRTRRRMLREAQAMARLNHPNVISIHDVGEQDGRVFFAMDLVEGPTLAQWLAQGPHPWRQVLAVVRAAGRGLAAAHAQGLVHRDFKPDNVLVGDPSGPDPRVFVTDFGIAMAATPASPSSSGDGAMAPTFDALSTTGATTMVGTPAYMAPEQHLGEPVGPAADQFALCVVLYEALYGQRPFAADSTAMLAWHITTGRVRPPAHRGVPRWMYAVVRRGLRIDPAQRWPSVAALLAALERDPRRRRRTAMLAGAAVVAAGVWSAWRARAEVDVLARCERAAAAIDEDYDANRRDAIADAWRRSNVPYASTAWDHTAPRLDDWAARWRQQRLAVCRGARVDSSRDATELDLAVDCLDQQRARFSPLVDRLVDADEPTIRRAVTSVADLPDPATCAHAVGLGAQLPPDDPDTRREIARLRRRLAALRTTADLGRDDLAFREAVDVAAQAEGLGWAPLVVDAKVEIGLAHQGLGDSAAAADTLEAAYFEATQLGYDAAALRAATQLVLVTGTSLSRRDDALRWFQLAQVHAERVASVDDVQTATRLALLAAVHRHAGAYDEAIAAQTESLRIREASLGPEHPSVAIALVKLANVHTDRGDFDAATPLLERAMDIDVATLGPEHPDTTLVLSSLAKVAWEQGDYRRALAHFEQTLARRRHVLGPSHPLVIEALRNVGAMYLSLGDFETSLTYTERALRRLVESGRDDPAALASTLSNLAVAHASLGATREALVAFERVYELTERRLGPDHLEVADTLHNLGGVHIELGEYPAAIDALQRALRIREAAVGHEHPAVARTLQTLGLAQLRQGDVAAASTSIGRALEIRRATLPDSHPELAHSWQALGDVRLAEGEPAPALAAYETALLIFERVPSAADNLADARLSVAQALLQTGGDRTRAATLAELARQTYETAPRPDPARLQAIMDVMAESTVEPTPG